jgi:small subunit ribosomal protein S10
MTATEPIMRKRISTVPATPGEKKQRTPGMRPVKNPIWKNQLFLHLESPDPNLLDKETSKLYLRIRESGAQIQGPVPLPVRFQEGSGPGGEPARIHRRMFKVLSPTGKTVSLLEKLSLSGSVTAFVEVEEEDAPSPPSSES